MLKTLLKKQLFEINKSFFYDYRRGKSRTPARIALSIAMYVIIIFGVLGSFAGSIAGQLAGPLTAAGYGWLYFLIMNGIALIFGAFGSVFSSYSTLYMSKDNEIMLSMPIPIRYIMISRLLGVYFTGLLYTAIILVPSIIMYYLAVKLTFWKILGPVVLLIMTSLFVLELSTGLGWVVAKLSGKFKNKSLTRVIITLLGIGIYYLVCFKAANSSQSFIGSIGGLDIKITGSIYPLYIIGSAASGNPLHMLILSVAVIALFFGVYTLLNITFIKIVTTKTGTSKAVYKEGKVHVRSQGKALIFKETKHLLSSPIYLLNCALGTLLMPIAGIALLIKGNSLIDVLNVQFGAVMKEISIFTAGAVCLIMAVNDITAPSVSLEGKELWISQSLPVTALQVLRAKIWNHVLFTLPSAVFLALCAVFTLKIGFLPSALILILTAIECLLFAEFGLFTNLIMPNMNWINEALVVKQSYNILLVLLSSWAFGALIVLSGVFLRGKMNANLILGLWCLLAAALTALMDYWLRTKGAKIFANL